MSISGIYDMFSKSDVWDTVQGYTGGYYSNSTQGT